MSERLLTCFNVSLNSSKFLIQKFNFVRKFNFDISSLTLDEVNIIIKELEEEDRQIKARNQEAELKRQQDERDSAIKNRTEKTLRALK